MAAAAADDDADANVADTGITICGYNTFDLYPQPLLPYLPAPQATTSPEKVAVTVKPEPAAADTTTLWR